jgi:hypothetical protein
MNPDLRYSFCALSLAFYWQATAHKSYLAGLAGQGWPA